MGIASWIGLGIALAAAIGLFRKSKKKKNFFDVKEHSFLLTGALVEE